MTKGLKKITEGTKKDREIKWFSELSDKRMSVSFKECMYSCGVHQLGKSIKVHLYWAMKNCEASPDKLQELIMNVPNHYKVSQ